MSASCRGCVHYDLEAFRLSNGKLRIVKDKVARCLFDMDRLARKFPASLPERNRPTQKHISHMRPDDGARCPQFTRRDA